MCMEKHVLVKKMFKNMLSMDLSQHTCIKKTVDGDETHKLSYEGTVLSAVVSKEGHAESLLEQKRTLYY